MDGRTLATVFATVFLAELGDKTQLATMLFASDRQVSKLTVFLGAALALVTTSAIGTVAGAAVSRVVGERALSVAAGVGFLLIGAYTLWRAFQPAS